MAGPGGRALGTALGTSTPLSRASLTMPLMATLVLLACCISTPADAASRQWTPDTFPDPTQDPDACGRTGITGKQSWICDPDR